MSAPLLHRERLRVQTPCHERWEEMAGSGSCPSQQRRASAAVAVKAAATLLLAASGCDSEPSEPELWPEVEAERVRLDEARMAKEGPTVEPLASPSQRSIEDDWVTTGMLEPQRAAPDRVGMIAREGSPLSGRQFWQVLQDKQSALERCCDQGPATSELRKLMIKVRVRPRGTVAYAAVEAATTPELARCVTVSIKRWRFAKAEAESEFGFPLSCPARP